jgi:hypothetical protein
MANCDSAMRVRASRDIFRYPQKYPQKYGYVTARHEKP